MLKSLRKYFATLMITIILATTMTSCYTLEHNVGNGAQGNKVTNERQWYILWGLVPINNVDGGAMANNAKDYTITTQMTVVDFLIGIVGNFVTVQSRTVEVRQ